MKKVAPLMLCLTFLGAAILTHARPLPVLHPAFITAVKRSVIKIYPNPSFDGNVFVSTTTAQLHLYIFDVQGNMLQQTGLKTKMKQRLNTLPKGIYMYDVFKEDESIEYGKLEIK